MPTTAYLFFDPENLFFLCVLLEHLDKVLEDIDNDGNLAHKMLDREAWVEDGPLLLPLGALGKQQIRRACKWFHDVMVFLRAVSVSGAWLFAQQELTYPWLA